MPAISMTEGELKSFADKLEAFGASLSPKEQALLKDILVRAATADEDDVEGHGFIADPVLWQHLIAMSHAMPWLELHHHLNAVIVHIGSLTHLSPTIPPTHPGV